jgi:hypothetical protein
MLLLLRMLLLRMLLLLLLHPELNASMLVAPAHLICLVIHSHVHFRVV